MDKYWLGRWKFLLLGNPVTIDTEDLRKTMEDVYRKLSSQMNKSVNKAVIKVHTHTQRWARPPFEHPFYTHYTYYIN